MPLAPAYAALGLPDRIVPQCGAFGVCGLCQLVTLANNVLTTGIYLSVFFAAVLFAYAGFVYLSAYGDSGKIGKAHEIFRDVAIGLVIILSAWLIVDTLMHTLTGTKFGQNWGAVC